LQGGGRSREHRDTPDCLTNPGLFRFILSRPVNLRVCLVPRVLREVSALLKLAFALGANALVARTLIAVPLAHRRPL
jgi:hypothetical protein